MKSLRNIRWHQGLFLQPQHFQLSQLNQQALFSESLRLSHSGLESGIYELEYDSESLTFGRIELSQLSVVMPDGNFIKLNNNANVGSLSINIEDYGHLDSLLISLVLPSLKRDEGNISSSQTAIYAEAEDLLFQDLFTGSEAVSIPLAAFNPYLAINYEGNLNSSETSIVLMELRIIDDRLVEQSAFIPNVIYTHASSGALAQLAELKKELLSRYEQLESFNTLHSNSTQEVSISNLRQVTALSTIAKYIATLNFYLSNNSRFSECFLSLLQLASELTIFSREYASVMRIDNKFSELSRLNSDKYSESFIQLSKLISELANQLTITPELIENLHKVRDATFVANLKTPFIEAGSDLYIRLRSSEINNTLVDNFMQTMKLGAAGQVEIYHARALPGICLKQLSNKPVGISSSPDSFYFQLDKSDPKWDKAVSVQQLSLFWQNAPSDLKADLIVVRA